MCSRSVLSLSLSLQLAMFPFVEVSVRTLAGDARICDVLPNEYLCEAGERIGDAFDKPGHRVRLVNNHTNQVHTNPHAQPFRTCGRSFTVAFDWVSRWTPHMGRLLALADVPANGDAWPHHSADKLHAGSAYSTPYTRKTWAPSLGLDLKETVACLDLERCLAEPGFSRRVVVAIRRAGRYSCVAKLTVADVRNLLFVAEEAQLHTGPSMRLAGKMLDVYLRGVGLKPSRRRYTQKSAPRPEVPLHRRLRGLKARARQGLLG